MGYGHMQIGAVAERTGLSIRTIRYYGEVCLVEPSARSQGGFRLYTEQDVQRLLLIREMKTLDLSLEQIRELLGLLEGRGEPATDEAEATGREERLALYLDAAQARTRELEQQLERVMAFVDQLRAASLRHQPLRR